MEGIRNNYPRNHPKPLKQSNSCRVRMGSFKKHQKASSDAHPIGRWMLKITTGPTSYWAQKRTFAIELKECQCTWVHEFLMMWMSILRWHCTGWCYFADVVVGLPWPCTSKFPSFKSNCHSPCTMFYLIRVLWIDSALQDIGSREFHGILWPSFRNSGTILGLLWKIWLHSAFSQSQSSRLRNQWTMYPQHSYPQPWASYGASEVWKLTRKMLTMVHPWDLRS